MLKIVVRVSILEESNVTMEIKSMEMDVQVLALLKMGGFALVATNLNLTHANILKLISEQFI